MTKSRKIMLVGLCLIAALSSVVATRRGPRNRETFLAEAVMPDGKHRLRLIKLVQGPLTYDWKEPTPALLRMLLPAELLPPYLPFRPVKISGIPAGQPFVHMPQTADGISFLFRVVDKNGEYVRGPNFQPTVVFEESTGFEFGPPSRGGELPRDGVICGCRAAIPRRDRRLKIRVDDRLNASLPMQFELENPFFKVPEAEWKPMQLPVTVGADVTTATLRSFQFRQNGLVDAEINVDARGFIADFTSLWLEDVTGNRGTILSPFEPAWKLHAQIQPVDISAAPAKQVRYLGQFFIPPQNETLSIGAKAQSEGVEIELVSIEGGQSGTSDERLPDDQFDSPNGAYGLRRDRPLITINWNRNFEQEQLLVRLTVDGREVQKNAVSNREGGRDVCVVSFQRPAPGAMLRVEAAVARRLDVEFLIPPRKPPEFKDR